MPPIATENADIDEHDQRPINPHRADHRMRGIGRDE
jgi:hypothetical protein